LHSEICLVIFEVVHVYTEADITSFCLQFMHTWQETQNNQLVAMGGV